MVFEARNKLFDHQVNVTLSFLPFFLWTELCDDGTACVANEYHDSYTLACTTPNLSFRQENRDGSTNCSQCTL